MNASLTLLQSVLPASVSLQVRVPPAHPSAQILGTERMGSGTLVDPSGIVLTVGYICLGAQNVDVTLVDGTRAAGRVVARDFQSGLAAIQISGGAYEVAREPRGAELAIGQEVFIAAAAGGTERRVNSGAISALEPFEAFWEYRLERAIVTTAMNPGLGGGALFTTRGELVGVVSLDLNEIGRFTLAIPADHWFSHRQELLTHGRRTTRPARAWVGLYCYMVRDNLVIAGVLPGTPSERAGLRPGDVIVSVDGQPVHVRSDLYARLWDHQPGETIRFHVFRDSAVREVAVDSTDAETFFA
ncbi:MAG: S1C family serine protease [Candidatus Binatia bacterium]